MKQTFVLFKFISILLLGLKIFTSFHTYPGLHGRAPGLSALSWHLTNARDGGRITTRVWNRSRSALTIVNSSGSEIARFICDTAVHQPIQSVFSYLSSIWITVDSVWYLAENPRPGAREAQALLSVSCRRQQKQDVRRCFKSNMQVFLPATSVLLSASCSSLGHINKIRADIPDMFHLNSGDNGKNHHMPQAWVINLKLTGEGFVYALVKCWQPPLCWRVSGLIH